MCFFFHNMGGYGYRICDKTQKKPAMKNDELFSFLYYIEIILLK